MIPSQEVYILAESSAKKAEHHVVSSVTCSHFRFTLLIDLYHLTNLRILFQNQNGCY